jgi:hypothetical protein
MSHCGGTASLLSGGVHWGSSKIAEVPGQALKLNRKNVILGELEGTLLLFFLLAAQQHPTHTAAATGIPAVPTAAAAATIGGLQHAIWSTVLQAR